MDKSILISIQPKWVEKIASGEKTIEVRKTKPNLEMPFKCYVYATKPKHYYTFSQYMRTSDENLYLLDKKIIMSDPFSLLIYEKKYEYVNGKVIGEFTCDNIERFDLPMPAYFSEVSNNIKELLGKACLSMSEAHHYIDDKDGYGWHITDLKIYDKPKELIEFCKPFNPNMDIHEFFKHIGGGFPAPDFKSKYDFCDKITRPPQSWCYVED